MRTTVLLDDELFASIKTHAARNRRTVTSVVEEALRRLLAEQASATTQDRVVLPVSRHRGGTRAGVDLDDSATLLDVMESDASS